MLDTIVSIILFIVAFGALICIHEAGHLAMAKLFKVYCKEYSIGFGPAIFSRKKEGHETKFSIRAIPFGGYVAMYGEGLEEDPDFKDIPKERSLEGIKKWKKAIIISAGVILNAILAFVLIFISNFAFPVINYTRHASLSETARVELPNVKDDDKLTFVLPDSYKTEDGKIRAFSYEFTDEKKIIHGNSFFIVDSDVTVVGDSEDHYVLTFMFNADKKDPVFSDGLMMYHAVSKEKLEETFKYDTQLKKDLIEWSKQSGSPEYYPNFEAGLATFYKETEIKPKLIFERGSETIVAEPTITIGVKEKGKTTTNTYENIGLSFKRDKQWLPGKTRLKNTFHDYGSAASAVFKGLGVLFTGGLRNLSGVVGIFDASASLYSNYTFATYLYFWGLISVNLAIFNLLPFPGLDGWQLLVTTIEGISRKKLPNKFKTIMSLIGLALLFSLMLLVIIFDVLRIIGV